jgi:hypothetical protein
MAMSDWTLGLLNHRAFGLQNDWSKGLLNARSCLAANGGRHCCHVAPWHRPSPDLPAPPHLRPPAPDLPRPAVQNRHPPVCVDQPPCVVTPLDVCYCHDWQLLCCDGRINDLKKEGSQSDATKTAKLATGVLDYTPLQGAHWTIPYKGPTGLYLTRGPHSTGIKAVRSYQCALRAGDQAAQVSKWATMRTKLGGPRQTDRCRAGRVSSFSWALPRVDGSRSGAFNT